MLPRSSRLHEYNAQELSNTAWAYAKAGVKDEDFFLKIAAMARSKLRDYNAQNLTNTVDGRGRRTFVRSVTRGECVSSFQRAPFLRASERAMASLSSLEEVSAALPPLLERGARRSSRAGRERSSPSLRESSKTSLSSCVSFV